MVNMEHDISFQCLVGFMFYKALVNEIGNGRIEPADRVRRKKTRN